MTKLWSLLVHLGTNMWLEKGNYRAVHEMPEEADRVYRQPASDVLRFDDEEWEIYLKAIVREGVNAIVFDIGEGLVYPSHPELACQGAWTPERLRKEAERLQSLGIEIIPKLNFSTAHDAWLGEYAYRVSTPEYHEVCRACIADVCRILHPRFFHLGFDEENYEIQKLYDYALIRQNDLWWNDLLRLIGYVEEQGARAMMWSDYAREHLDEFIERCPRSVVQCVWYYFSKFDEPLPYMNAIRVRPFTALAEAGFDIFPSGSLSFEDENFAALTRYCAQNVPHERLLGFMQTTWNSVTPEWRELLDHSAATVGEMRRELESSL